MAGVAGFVEVFQKFVKLFGFLIQYFEKKAAKTTESPRGRRFVIN